jgi:hypothetical protein
LYIVKSGKESRLGEDTQLSDAKLAAGDRVVLREIDAASGDDDGALLLSSSADGAASTSLLAAASTSLAALKDVAKKHKIAKLFDARDKHRQSALHIAAFAGREDVVAWLLAHKKVRWISIRVNIHFLTLACI